MNMNENIALQNGNNYYHGINGVEKNIQKAIEWYQIAAQEGAPPAQSYMGYFYRNGIGVPQDILTSIEWYRLAAENGYVDAQWSLYYIYTNGEGVPKDSQQAQKFLQMAADCGDSDAEFNIALQKYNQGNCTEETLLLVISVMEKLDNQKYVRASYWLGVKYYYGIHFLDLKDQQKAIYYLQRAKELGDANAACILGEAYLSGAGVEKDLNKGVEYLYFAYDYGNDTTSVLSDLGKCFIEGSGVEQDLELGSLLLNRYLRILKPDDERISITKRYLELISEKYYIKSNGKMHVSGEEIMSRLNQTIQAHSSAAWENYFCWLNTIQGCSEKYAALGFLYSESGDIKMKDLHKSYECFRKSVCYNMQNAFTLQWLGWYYENGIATEKDTKRAYDSYTLSNQLCQNSWVQARLNALS